MIACDTCGDEPSHWDMKGLVGTPCGRDLSDDNEFPGMDRCIGTYRLADDKDD